MGYAFCKEVRYAAQRSAYAITMSAMLVASAIVVAPDADAQQAYVSLRTNIRSGPDHRYPPVAWLNRGSAAYVNGCVRGYHWCDVSVGGLRGWVNARHITYAYGNRNVIVYGNGLAFGAPVVGFTLGSYWDNHYRDRPWYHHHGYWSDWRPGIAPPPSYYRAPQAYVAPRPAYVAPRPVYVAPRPVYVAPRREPHAHRHPNQVRNRSHVVREHQRSAPPHGAGLSR